jgi:LysM repeat protein
MGLSRAKIKNEATGEEFYVSFNPEEYTINKDNNFASQAIPGLTSPLLQFVHGNLRTLDMELFFDTFEQQTDVRDQTQKVTSLLQINSDLHAPPVVQVVWGSLFFRGVLAKAGQKFIKFLNDGRPARARLNVTFQEYLDAETQSKEANLQTADFSKYHVVKQNETLSSIAGDYYEDAKSWRPIAIANSLSDPRAIYVGQELRVPALPFVDPETGDAVV